MNELGNKHNPVALQWCNDSVKLVYLSSLCFLLCFVSSAHVVHIQVCIIIIIIIIVVSCPPVRDGMYQSLSAKKRSRRASKMGNERLRRIKAEEANTCSPSLPHTRSCSPHCFHTSTSRAERTPDKWRTSTGWAENQKAGCWETERRTDSGAVSALKLGHDSGLINNPHTNMEMKSKNQWLIESEGTLVVVRCSRAAKSASLCRRGRETIRRQVEIPASQDFSVLCLHVEEAHFIFLLLQTINKKNPFPISRNRKWHI